MRYAYGVAVALLLGGTAFSVATGQAGRGGHDRLAARRRRRRASCARGVNTPSAVASHVNMAACLRAPSDKRLRSSSSRSTAAATDESTPPLIITRTRATYDLAARSFATTSEITARASSISASVVA